MRKGQRRKQTGSLSHNDSSWYVRVFEDVWEATTKTVVRRRVAKKLPVPYAPPYDTPASVQRYVEEILFPLNAQTANPLSTRTVREFAEQAYFPRLQARGVRQITYNSYRSTWSCYIAPYLDPTLTLRDFSTRHGEDLLLSIGKHRKLGRNSWAKIKSLLANIFAEAKRLDTLSPGAANPMREAKPPRTPTPERGKFYTVEEIKTMLLVLSEPAKTIVMTAAHTGLRKSELRGLQWSDFGPDYLSLTVGRSVAPGGEINQPKTPSSRASIPITHQLAAALRAHRQRLGPHAIWVFPGPQSGLPSNLDNLATLTIRPALSGTNVGWHGWHAFRRSTATLLHHAGVDDKSIQTVLRHSDIKLTQNIYEFSLDADQRAAINRLGEALAGPPEKKSEN